MRSYSINAATSRLFSDNCSIESVSKWYEEIGIGRPSDNDEYVDIINYKDHLNSIDNLLNPILPNISIYNEETKTETLDPLGSNLLESINLEAYLDQNQIYKTHLISFSWNDNVLTCSNRIDIEDEFETLSITGNKSMDEVTVLINDAYTNLLSSIEIDPNPYLYYSSDLYDQQPNYIRLGNNLLKELEINITNTQIETKSLYGNDFLIAQGTVVKDDFSDSLNIVYSVTTDSYKFDLSQLNLILYDYLKEKGQALELDCSDCILAPVSKQFALKSSYSPSVSATGWSGGGSLKSDARTQLTAMLNEARSQGINTTVISAYRSYYDQVATFNYWVNREVAAGLSRYAAELKANNYSARPGQSEHQLGNTVDLKCSVCGSFDNSSGNLSLYRFLKENAYKYGFVISYPDGKKDLTGYNSEPWHVRYIGIEASTKLFERDYLSENDEYLTRFLLEYNYY